MTASTMMQHASVCRELASRNIKLGFKTCQLPSNVSVVWFPMLQVLSVGCFVGVVLSPPWMAEPLLFTTFGGYIIICAVSIIGIISRAVIPQICDISFSVLGVVLNWASGGILITVNHLDHVPVTMACGATALINSFVFLIDAVIVYMDIAPYPQY